MGYEMLLSEKAAELYSRILHDKKIYLPIKKEMAVEVQFRGVDFLKSRKYDAAEESICEALYQSEKLKKALETSRKRRITSQNQKKYTGKWKYVVY